MARFEGTNESEEMVAAEREAIWSVLTDPALLARLSPLVGRIDVDGDHHWCWHLTGISALGVSIAPSFRERMEFGDDGRRITFAHEPRDGRPERAGADGVYRLSDVDGGTRLSIHITIHVDLPLPRSAEFAAERVIERTMQRTGDRFATNLKRHLGVR